MQFLQKLKLGIPFLAHWYNTITVLSPVHYLCRRRTGYWYAGCTICTGLYTVFARSLPTSETSVLTSIDDPLSDAWEC
jgi:hypothetical protein